jgi:cytochrome c551/c552
MRALRLVLPLAVLMMGLLVTTTTSFAKKEYATKEKKSCVTCHVAAGKKDLNDVGKCYAKKHVLEGCEAAKK